MVVGTFLLRILPQSFYGISREKQHKKSFPRKTQEGLFQFKETRLVVVFCTFKERHRAGAAADKTGLGVDAELVACIDDVEVAHGQLADTVGSCEHGVALFHCQAFRFVCQVGRTCIEALIV